ncbi:GNAT family N-acetyltransferase [Sphingobium boeckii]|uniref:Putative acetyltransferase n=1 Tax=Sphingobium boeckii TaxID=1082345 RepID=A0A7W9EET5_9SPHN|nr:GNAT family N-acetyltransferase [Sphingobium boeckii]MBB5686598.1 putative acetyltransferase [Sphingobium boeckii]
MEILPGDFAQPQIIALLHAHMATMQAQSPPESVHALSLEALQTPDITFWAGWDGPTLLAVAALKAISVDHGEIKSMHTAQAMRGRGIAQIMLDHIVQQAVARGYGRLSLETGSMDAFRPARDLYLRNGFAICPPFDGYAEDSNSICMTRTLTPR